MMEEKKKRITRCRYSLPHCKGGSIEYHCVAGGWKDDEVRVCTEEECEQCIRFNSRYIEYPIFVNKIENRAIKAHSMGHQIGSLVAVRPCGEEEDLKNITDEDIENTWYMKVYRWMHSES